MGWETFQFGMLRLDNEIQYVPFDPTGTGDVPSYQYGQHIDIVDVHDESGITWIRPDSMELLVADRVLLNNVSWIDLNEAGFVKGRMVTLNGKDYICRLLDAGSWYDEPNEWDDIVGATTENDAVWHWGDMYSWGREYTRNSKTASPTRGGKSARMWAPTINTLCRSWCGFRPALDPMTMKEQTVVLLEGQRFMLSRMCSATGKTSYLELSPIEKSLFRSIPNGTVVKMYSLIAHGKAVQADLIEKTLAEKDTPICLLEGFLGKEFLIPWIISNGKATTNI